MVDLIAQYECKYLSLKDSRTQYGNKKLMFNIRVDY